MKVRRSHSNSPGAFRQWLVAPTTAAGAITGGTIGAFTGNLIGTIAGMLIGAFAATAIERTVGESSKAQPRDNMSAH